MAVPDSTRRFSSRVGNYVRYRPGYPAALLDLLKHDCGLTAASVIADVLPRSGYRVFSLTPVLHSLEDVFMSLVEGGDL